MSKISNEKVEQIISLRKEGKTYKEIEEITGCCKKTCVKYLKETGNYDYKPPIEITPELLEEIQKRYNEVKNIKIVAKEFNTSAPRLRKCGLIIDKPKKTIDEINNQTRYSKKIKEQLVEYKGGKCQICGYNKCSAALEFHHIDPNKKDFTISGGTKSFEKLKPEVDKCIMVCSNCHKEIHSGLINLNEFL